MWSQKNQAGVFFISGRHLTQHEYRNPSNEYSLEGWPDKIMLNQNLFPAQQNAHLLAQQIE